MIVLILLLMLLMLLHLAADGTADASEVYYLNFLRWYDVCWFLSSMKFLMDTSMGLSTLDTPKEFEEVDGHHNRMSSLHDEMSDIKSYLMATWMLMKMRSLNMFKPELLPGHDSVTENDMVGSTLLGTVPYPIPKALLSRWFSSSQGWEIFVILVP